MNVVRLPPINDRKITSKKHDYVVGKSSWSLEYRQKFRYLPPLRRKQATYASMPTAEPVMHYNRAHESADAHWNLTQKEVGRRVERRIVKHLRRSLIKQMDKRIQDLDEQSGSAGSAYRPRSDQWPDIGQSLM